LHYSLPYDGEVELAIYDLLGRRVRTLESGFKTAGEYVMKWNGVDEKGRSVASGVYFYRLQASAPNGTRIHKSGKMTLLQ
jgi:flagellar hook assembly protein FlgD